jgi:hypothetical protein
MEEISRSSMPPGMGIVGPIGMKTKKPADVAAQITQFAKGALANDPEAEINFKDSFDSDGKLSTAAEGRELAKILSSGKITLLNPDGKPAEPGEHPQSIPSSVCYNGKVSFKYSFDGNAPEGNKYGIKNEGIIVFNDVNNMKTDVPSKFKILEFK